MGLYRRKDSPFWWYKFKPKGAVKPIVASTEEADAKVAQAIFEKVRTDYNMGKHFGRAARIAIAELREKYLAIFRKQKSYPAKTAALENFFGSPKIKGKKWANEVNREDALWYKVWRSDYAKNSTVNRELAIVRHMYNVATEDMGYRLENPVAKIEFYSERKFRRFRHMLREEKDKFFADPLTPQHLKDVVYFDIKTGLRQGELRDLKLTDLDFENELVRVVAGEEDKTRFVPMGMGVVDLLKRRVEHAKAVGSHWVFCNDDGTQLSRHGWITTAFEWACKRNKIENLHFHDLRHTFASDFIMAGGDFKTLGEYMGHSTATMTERYAHLTPKYKAAQIMILPKETAYNETLDGPDEKVTLELRKQYRSEAQKRKTHETV